MSKSGVAIIIIFIISALINIIMRENLLSNTIQVVEKNLQQGPIFNWQEDLQYKPKIKALVLPASGVNAEILYDKFNQQVEWKIMINNPGEVLTDGDLVYFVDQKILMMVCGVRRSNPNMIGGFSVIYARTWSGKT
jgi:hypothetical protein